MNLDLQELKQSVRIADYLGVEEKEKEFFINSPFRDERTPSFKINPIKNTWYDFGIGEGGTIIDLIAKVENVNVKNAVKRLRELAGEQLSTNAKIHTIKKPINEQNEKKNIKIL